MTKPPDRLKAAPAKGLNLLATLLLVATAFAQDACDIGTLQDLDNLRPNSEVWAGDRAFFDLRGDLRNQEAVSSERVKSVEGTVRASVDMTNEKRRQAYGFRQQWPTHTTPLSADRRVVLSANFWWDGYVGLQMRYGEILAAVEDGNDAIIALEVSDEYAQDMLMARLYLHLADVTCRLDRLEPQ